MTLSLDLVEPLAEVASPSSDAALREASTTWSVRQARELAAWHRAREEAAAEARAAARAGGAGDADVEPRPMQAWRVGRICGTGVRAPDTALQRHAAIGLGRIHQGRLRRGEVVLGARSGGGAGRARGRRWTAAPASDPLGYVPYDQRLYDQLMALFQVGDGSGSRSDSGRATGGGRASGPVRTSGRGACAARTARRLLR